MSGRRRGWAAGRRRRQRGGGRGLRALRGGAPCAASVAGELSQERPRGRGGGEGEVVRARAEDATMWHQPRKSDPAPAHARAAQGEARARASRRAAAPCVCQVPRRERKTTKGLGARRETATRKFSVFPHRPRPRSPLSPLPLAGTRARAQNDAPMVAAADALVVGLCGQVLSRRVKEKCRGRGRSREAQVERVGVYAAGDEMKQKGVCSRRKSVCPLVPSVSVFCVCVCGRVAGGGSGEKKGAVGRRRTRGAAGRRQDETRRATTSNNV